MQESNPRNMILFHDMCSVVLIVQRTWYSTVTSYLSFDKKRVYEMEILMYRIFKKYSSLGHEN